MAYGEAAHDTVDLNLDLVPYVGSRYEDPKALNPSYAIPFTSGIFNLSVVFGANRHGGEGAELCIEE